MPLLVKQAVILAAGKGTRIGAFKRNVPKSLTKFLGIPIIERNIRLLEKAGIEEVVVVGGFAGDVLKKFLLNLKTSLKIQFVHNEEWEKSNGVSLLKAEEALKPSPFLLIMADHVFDPEIIKHLIKSADGCYSTLAVDSDVSDVHDIEDATKVWMEEGKIVQIGKHLTQFNAIDTGAFILTPDFIQELKKIYSARGDCSITEGVKKLAEKGKMRALNVTGKFWADLDTLSDIKFARKKLIRKLLIKPTDGLISRHINRKISTRISTLLAGIRFNPNLATLISGVVGVLSGFLVARATPIYVLAGGLLYQLASVLDGVDGELAKITLRNSRMGQWLDTISDNLAYVSFTVGLTIACKAVYGVSGITVGLFATSGVLLFLGLSYYKLIRENLGGSLLAIHENPKGFWQSLLRRDFFAFLFMVLSFFNLLLTMTVLTAAGAWAGTLWHVKKRTRHAE